MRVSFLGNCQVCGIAGALRFLLPDAEIHAFWYGAAPAEQVERIRQTLLRSDYVFLHDLPSIGGPLSTASLREAVRNLFPIPVVHFTGFHPDTIYFHYNGKNMMSPVGLPHSAIIAAAYSLKLPADRVAGLFNSFVFRRLGYYDEFPKAQSFLAAVFKKSDFDLADFWDAWMIGVPFMHTPFHPRTDLLASLAKSAGQRAGIVRANCAAPVIPYDYLSYATILPVFPELAAPLNLPGSCLFKRPGNQVQMNGNTLLLNLDEMVAESYEIYSRYPPEALHHSRMQAIARILSEVVR